MTDPKIVLWDIEATHLKADFGTLLCVGLKTLGVDQTPRILSVRQSSAWRVDKTDDQDLVRQVVAELSDADMWVTYNGKRFDVPYVQAKALEYNVGILPNVPHVDLYWIARQNLAIARRSLEKVAWYLRLNTQKTEIDGRTWKRAAVGHIPSLQYVESHCKADVDLLEEAYLKLRPLVRTHPRVRTSHSGGGCGTCGSDLLQRRGSYITKGGPVARLQCKACGTWSRA